MAEAGSEARIRDLKKRLELDPGSRLFVALADEYRKSHRLAEALSTLQKGLLAHPNYLSAQVALGRAYLEAGQITEAIVAFSKTLAADPGNLVAARSLADIYLSRGESVEAVKKYKLYRALSGDRRVDEIIRKLELELAPPPPPPASTGGEIPPPPTFFDQSRVTGVRRSLDVSAPPKPSPLPESRSGDPLDITAVPFEPEDSQERRPPDLSMPGLVSRDTPLLGVSPPGAPPRAEPETPPPPPAAPAHDSAPLTGMASTTEPMAEAQEVPAEESRAAEPDTAWPSTLAPAPLPERAAATDAVLAAEPRAESAQHAVEALPPFSPAPALEPLVRAEGQTSAARSAPSTHPEAVLPSVPEPKDFGTRAFRISEILGTPTAPDTGREAVEHEPSPPEEPRGRVLADLYYAQGHFAEALRIYDDLVAANPEDTELKRMRRDAEARLLPAATTAGAAAPDPALARRLAKIRVLKRWLGVVQTG